MGKYGAYKQYANKVDTIARAAFKDYRSAEKAYQAAEQTAKQYPYSGGYVAAEYAAKSARAKADLLEAKEHLKAAKQNLEDHNMEIAALRKELAAEVADNFSADPKAIDTNTLTLLNAGILTPHEYEKLLREAQAAGNHTMMRMVGKAAEKAAATEESRDGDNNTARSLRAISYMAMENTGSSVLQSFDLLAEVYKRTASNTEMIGDWDNLTASTMSEFQENA